MKADNAATKFDVPPCSTMLRLLRILVLLPLPIVSACDRSSKPTERTRNNEEQRIDISLEMEGRITVHHPGDVSPVSLFWEEDGILVNHNLGKDETPVSISGNIVRVWLKGQKEGRIWVQRNSSDDELLGGQGDRSLYEDQNGDGVVDYKRNRDGVFRVAEIVWEKIGDIPAVPPDEANHRVDTHRDASELQGVRDQGADLVEADQSAAAPEPKSVGEANPKPESEARPQ